MRKLRLLTLVMFALAVAVAAHAQFTLLYNLGTNSGDPAFPDWIGAFAQGRDGNLYSTSQDGSGPSHGFGTVFQLTPAGKMKVLHSFVDFTAYQPWSGLTLGTDGSLYGTTTAGGPPKGTTNDGTVFKVTTSGTFKVLHYFTGADGSVPMAPPIQATDGNFYGTTRYGKGGVWGTVYKMTPSGNVTPLIQSIGFPSALMQGTDGNFYGTLRAPSGATRNGAIFKITPTGTFKVLHTFAGYPKDGSDPSGTIIQASDGNFYGTTVKGGSHDDGTIYQMTPTGALKIIHNFDSANGLGYWPFAGLVQATDGNFYGGTYGSGAGTGIGGVLFRVTSTGSYSVLHNFNFTMGGHPDVSLFQHTNGTFYADTFEGGSHSQGVLYSLKVGLHPFAALVTTSGRAGQVIQILGNGLTGATSVKFGTASASFTVVSDTYMTAVVPVAGTTGALTVATPSGFRVSSKNFKVLPVISSFSPTSGPVGTHVVITGTGLTQTTKVTFGGVAATTFTKSATQVTAIVPTGAQTGNIAITTTGGTATSAATFTVT